MQEKPIFYPSTVINTMLAKTRFQKDYLNGNIPLEWYNRDNLQTKMQSHFLVRKLTYLFLLQVGGRVSMQKILDPVIF